MKQFNNTYLNLEILAEECSEVVQAKAKIVRFGMNKANIKRLEREVGDVVCMLQILYENNTIDFNEVMRWAKYKREEKLPNYYTYTKEEGE